MTRGSVTISLCVVPFLGLVTPSRPSPPREVKNQSVNKENAKRTLHEMLCIFNDA